MQGEEARVYVSREIDESSETKGEGALKAEEEGEGEGEGR